MADGQLFVGSHRVGNVDSQEFEISPQTLLAPFRPPLKGERDDGLKGGCNAGHRCAVSFCHNAFDATYNRLQRYTSLNRLDKHVESKRKGQGKGVAT